MFVKSTKRSKKSNESGNNEERDEQILHSEIPSSEEENREEGTFSNQQESHSVTPVTIQVLISPMFFARFFQTNVLFSSYVLALAPKFCSKNALIKR